MERTGLIMEQLSRSGERLAAVLDVKATNKKDTPRSWAHSGAAAVTENQEGGIQE